MTARTVGSKRDMLVRHGMGQQWIDEFARSCARGVGRRSVLRSAVGAVAGLAGLSSRGTVPAAGGVVEVSLSDATRERIAGSLTLGDAGLMFDSALIGQQTSTVTVSDLGQRELIAVQREGAEATARYVGGALIVRATRTGIAPLAGSAAAVNPDTQPQAVAASAQPPTIDPQDIVAVEGDERVLPEVLGSREFALLPELSYALGQAGATGHRYRPSLGLHALGMTAGTVLGVGPATPGTSYRIKLPPQMAGTHYVDLFRRLETFECYDYQAGVRPEVEGLPQCPRPCERFPNRERDCYGMCGSSCTCWSWVCGDCCFHDFCAVHDGALRSCDEVALTDLADCVFAALPASYVLTGCDGQLF